MQSKEYKLPNGKKAIFEYDITTGVGEVDLECMDKLMAMITDRPQGWIPVSERLPEEETDVLICNSKGNIVVARYMVFDDGTLEWYTSKWHTGEVTAWMPLPEPYKAESED